MLERLTTSNPWWVNRAAIAQDFHLLRRAESRLQWLPRIVRELDLSVPAIYTIRGPRQVGKTTALKLMIERSFRETPEEEVLYYSCDLDKEPDVIREVVQAAKRLRPQAARWRILLDEVSSIPNWQSGVKWLWDNTNANHDTFVVTGSSAVDVAEGADRMPGRRGTVGRPDRILLPLSFADFARLHGVAPHAVFQVADFTNDQKREQVQQVALHLPQLQPLLERYLRCGGFPAAVVDEHANGTVSVQTHRTIWDMVESEVRRQNRDPVRAYRAVEHVVRTLSSATDWTKLAESLDTDRHTAEEYARLMSLTFSLLILYKYELHRGGPQIRAQKKLYLVDPLLAYIPRQIRQVGLDPEQAALVENAVIMGLFRSEERLLAEDFAVPQALFYWRSKSGGEVDALAGMGPIARRIPIEVKYRTTVDARGVAALTRSFQHGIVVTRDQLDPSGKYPRIPAALFLWLLGGESVLA